MQTHPPAGSSAALVIGVGNRDRGDDAIGPLVLDSLRGRLDPAVRLIEHRGEGLRLLTLWENAATVVLVDAVVSGAPPGTVHRFELTDAPLPVSLSGRSTHALGIAETVELGRRLGALPTRLHFVGVEGATFTPGAPADPRVSAAVATAGAAVIEILEARSMRSV